MTIKGTHHCDGPSRDSSYWEEAGTLWLWAWPDLLKWKKDLVWLLSPASSEKEPFGFGDLWGVDENGQMIIVETKRKDGDSAFSKFERFEEFFPENSINIDQLLSNWEGKLEQEMAFVRDYIESSRPSPLPTKQACPGVIPYSSKRIVVSRWLDLYKKKVVPLLKSKKRYADKVRSYLARVKKPHEPFYIGMSVVPSITEMDFTKGEMDDYRKLSQKFGTRLGGVVIGAKPLGKDSPNRWHIKSRSVDV